MKRTLKLSASFFATIALIVIALALPAAASTAPGLGTASTFAILAGTTVTNNLNPSTTLVTGDLGVSPGSAVTNMTGHLVGTQHTADTQANTAKSNLSAAYGVAAASPCNFNKTGQNLGTQTLTPGTYCQTTAPTLTGTLTLSGNGVFIFQIGSTLVTAPNATVALTNGAQACNVFWQVSKSATLDTTTTFVGTIMASASISLNNGATIAGRALAQTGGVTLINNRITVPTTCAAATVAGPTPAPAATPAVAGPPSSGGGPPQSEGFPWILLLGSGFLASAGVVAIGRSIRGQHRRT